MVDLLFVDDEIPILTLGGGGGGGGGGNGFETFTQSSVNVQ